MQIAFVLYEGFTSLDIIGPYEVLKHMPGVDAVFVADKTGFIMTDTGETGFKVDHTFADVPQPDVVVVPGGLTGTQAAMQNDALVGWLKVVYPGVTYMTSVCTGSLILGAAGLIDGLTVTTHWTAADTLPELGAKYTAERVVVNGNIWTAAGVSAGIDMGLTLAGKIVGEDMAKALQLAIEYDPQPPFEAGSPAKAGPELMALVQATFEGPAEV
ncbi:MAG: DJ-1/PfpI family protein [Parvibaculaceae bacterium]|nr:DJ-1/PfpI family protein [Parvibaculaceae bacterium]